MCQKFAFPYTGLSTSEKLAAQRFVRLGGGVVDASILVVVIRLVAMHQSVVGVLCGGAIDVRICQLSSQSTTILETGVHTVRL